MDCLVTKLKSVVDNNNLEYLDKLHINVHSVSSPNPNDFSIYVQTSSATNMYTTEGGHFTDGTLTQDRGTEAATNQNQKYSNGNYQLLLPLTNIRQLTNPSTTIFNITNWQVDGLNYKRLCKMNQNTLTTVHFGTYQDLLAAVEYTTHITTFGISNKNGLFNLDTVIQRIILGSSRTTNFKIVAFSKDHYTPLGGNLERNVHYISSTAYSVYNSGNTQKLYDAEKVNGVWVYTNA